MWFFRNLRAKVLVSVLVPGSLVLLAIAIIALYAYERVAKDVVQQRDAELARVSAARLSDGLTRFSRLLQQTAAEPDIQSMDLARVSWGLEKSQPRLIAFDAGVTVYDRDGIAVWSTSEVDERRLTTHPRPSEFEAVRSGRRPTFSDIFIDPVTSENVVLLTVPVLGEGTAFNGALGGLATVERSLIGAMFADVLELRPGRSGFAYLVDGQGRVIYHRQSAQLAKDFSGTDQVAEVTQGRTGAVLAEDLDGETVVSGFAPVPSTSWGIVTQERWSNVVGRIRDYNTVVLGLLALGSVLATGAIFLGTGRILRPVKGLTQGAQRIASGDFDYRITATTGDDPVPRPAVQLHGCFTEGVLRGPRGQGGQQDQRAQ